MPAPTQQLRHNGAMRSPEEMSVAVSDSMRERTGRSLAEWADLVEATSGVDPLDQNGVRRWLKDAHQVPQNSAWAIAFEVAGRHGWTMPTPEQFADQMYTGKKAALRPLHDAVVELAASMGDDAHVEGRATYTPIVRARQFCAVGPGPRTTVRVGLRYRDAPDDERLAPAKGFAQATHWLHLAEGDDPTELEGLVRLAYEQNG